MDISYRAIGVKAMLIKVNRTYEECVANGHLDWNRLADMTRGIWSTSRTTAEEIEYLFAMVDGEIVGVFHVVGVHDLRGDLPDYPLCGNNPWRVRERNALMADSLERARRLMPSNEYRLYRANLEEAAEAETQYKRRHDPFAPAVTAEMMFERAKRRLYYSVDDEDPNNLMRLIGEIAEVPGKNLRCQAPCVKNY